MASSKTVTDILLKIHACGKNISFRGPQMVSLLWHSPFLRNRVLHSLKEGRNVTSITLPQDMVENIDVVYILSGQPSSSCFYVLPEIFERINLVNLLYLSSYLIIADDLLIHLLKNFHFGNNRTIIPATYCAKYMMQYTKVADKLSLDMGIRPHKLPLNPTYKVFYKKVRQMIRSDRRYNSSPNFNCTFWPHYAVCGCERCAEMLFTVGSKPRQVEFTHTFPSHGKCPICPRTNALDVFDPPSP